MGRESYLSHWLSERAAEDVLKVRIHAGGDDDDEDKAEEPAGADRHENSVRDGFRGVGGFLAHVNARVERADYPNRAEPSEHESPASWPGRQVRGRCENVGSIVSVHCFTDWKRDNRCENQDEIHDHEDGLEPSHYSAHARGENSVKEDAGEKYGVDHPIGRCVCAI